MIKNYENLTDDNKKQLIENWEKLSNAQRAEVLRKQAEML